MTSESPAPAAFDSASAGVPASAPAAAVEKPVAAARGARTKGRPGWAMWALWKLSLVRLAWSVNTALLLFPIAFCVILVLGRMDPGKTPADKAYDVFTSVVMIKVFLSIVTPLIALSYGASVLGREREERTLVFLLVRPLPRPLLIAVQFFVALLCTEVVTLSSAWLLGALGGPAGLQGAWTATPVLALAAAAYTAFFLFISTLFRHAAVWGLLYALFVELFLGNMPGVVKQISINFYGRSILYAWGAPHGLNLPRRDDLFRPVDPDLALWVLSLTTVFFVLASIAVFSRREYQDLA